MLEIQTKYKRNKIVENKLTTLKRRTKTDYKKSKIKQLNAEKNQEENLEI